MSKMDGLRAMREARYAAAAARTASPATTPKPATASKTTKFAAKPAKKAASARAAATPEPGESLCGHRNMSGRTCTRERGHAAKSHRYS